MALENIHRPSSFYLYNWLRLTQSSWLYLLWEWSPISLKQKVDCFEGEIQSNFKLTKEDLAILPEIKEQTEYICILIR